MVWNNLFQLPLNDDNNNNDNDEKMVQSLEKSSGETLSTTTTTTSTILIDLIKSSDSLISINSSVLLLEQESSSNIPFLSSSSSINTDNMDDFQTQTNLTNESIFLSENFWNIFLITTYLLIVFISLFGNIFVCRVMITLFSGNNHNTTTTNILIFNLAIADLLLTCFNIPINLVRFVSTNWPFGSIICILTPFIQSLSAHCSSITMMVIAFERYRSLIRTSCFGIGFNVCRFCPYNKCTTKRKHRSIENNIVQNHSYRQSKNSWIWSILLIWICSIVLSIPHCLFSQVVVYPSSLLVDFEMIRCATVFPNKQNHLMLAILSPLSQYLLPIGLTALFYARIGCFLWRRTNPIGSVSANRRASIMKRKRKRIKMLVIVVAVFALCWFPLHLYVTLIEFKIIQHHFGIYFVTHWIAMSSVCYNPFIYCWLNETFRHRMEPFFHSLILFKNRIQNLLLSCCLLNRMNTNEIVNNNNDNNDLHETNVLRNNNINENNIDHDKPKIIIVNDQNDDTIDISNCNDERSSTF